MTFIHGEMNERDTPRVLARCLLVTADCYGSDKSIKVLKTGTTTN